MITDLKVEQVAISRLKPADYNPRIWTEDARKQLTASLDEFGFVQPIVANSSPERLGVVIGGNFKLDIALKRGLKTLPVVWVALSLENEKKLSLRLNKNQGTFDNELLADFGKDMLAEVGFDPKELEEILMGDGSDETPVNGCRRCNELRLAITGHERKEGHVVIAKTNE